MRKIFIVTASGAEAIGHYQDTIRRKRQIRELNRFVSPKEFQELNDIYHGRDFAIWGAIPGSGNVNTWSKMYPGDYVVFYQQGKLVLIGEVAYKLINRELAKYFWGTNKEGDTWENIYFIINEKEINVPLEKFNKYLEYRTNFTPQGFAAIEKERQKQFENKFGDFYGLMSKINEGNENQIKQLIPELLNYKVEIPHEDSGEQFSEHNEMQWRLIKLGKAAGNDIWIPKNDQGKSFKNYKFRDFVMSNFDPIFDIPKSILNIDCIWRYGNRIKSAFEIEHTTAIYSGLLRLSDLMFEMPNSNYPLIIVAPRDVKSRVCDQVRRPTFSNPYLKLNEAIKFLSYEKIRELDDRFSRETRK